ncbi:MAG: LamG domain-containing protein [Cyanobacteria bacterium P01_F01_bin.86]
MQSQPNLIVTQSGVSSRTQYILRNQEYIESLPIDGMTINIPQSWNLMSPGTQVTEEELDTWLAPIADFNANMENNYLLVNIDKPGDLFDDEAWDQVIENFRLMAQKAKETNFKGMIFDNEEYRTRLLNFPEDYPGAKAEDLPLYQEKMAERGKQIMEAINEGFPDSEVGVMHGPYLSVAGDDTPDSVANAITRQAGDASGHELRGPLFTGMLEGKGEDQSLIDMGELYALRSEEDFEQSYAYRSHTVPDQIDWDTPDELRETWDDEVEQSHMVYTEEFPKGYDQSPNTLNSTLKNAFNHSDGNVFLYSEHQSRDFFTPGAVSDDWIDAVRTAREDTNGGIENIDGLVAALRFNESSGRFANDSSQQGRNNRGQLIGDTQWTQGRDQGAVAFDGEGAIRLNNSKDINRGIHDERTISLWFKADSLTEAGQKQMLYEEGARVRGLNVYIEGDKLYVGGWNTPKQESHWQGTWLSTNQVIAGEWNHVALVLDGDETVQDGAFHSYLNGEQFGTGEGSQLWTHTGGIGIGSIQGGTRFHDETAANGHGFAGAIDEVRIYNNALNSNQVEALAM